MLTIFVIKRISLDALQKRSGPKEYRYYPRISLYRVSLYRVFTVVKIPIHMDPDPGLEHVTPPDQ